MAQTILGHESTCMSACNDVINFCAKVGRLNSIDFLLEAINTREYDFLQNASRGVEVYSV